MPAPFSWNEPQGWQISSLRGLESYYRLSRWTVPTETYRRRVAAYTGHALRRQRLSMEGAIDPGRVRGILRSRSIARTGESKGLAARIERVMAHGIADPDAWRLSQVITIPAAQQALARRQPIFTPQGTVNTEALWKPYMEALRKMGDRGYVAAATKAEHLMAGAVSRLKPTDISVAGEFYRGDKLGLPQMITHPTLAPRGVAAVEVGALGVSPPRLVTTTMARQRLGPFGQGRAQELLLQTAFVNPKTEWARRLAQGASESEIAFVSEAARAIQVITPGARPARSAAVRGAAVVAGRAGETVSQFGRFNALMVMGGKYFTGGELASRFTEQTGISAVVTRQLSKDPMALLEYMLQDVVASAAMQSDSMLRGKLPRAFKRYGFGSLEHKAGLAMLTPSQGLMEAGLSYATKKFGGMRGGAAVRYARMSREVQAFLGARAAIRGMTRELGLPMPLRTEFLPGIGPAKVMTAALRPRGLAPASVKGFKVNPLSLMGLTAQGTASAEIAQVLRQEALRQGGQRAQQWLAVLNPMLGRKLGPKQIASAGFREVGIWDLDPTLGSRLRGAKTVGDIRAILRSGMVPDEAMLLRLPEAIRMPTLDLIEEGTRRGLVGTKLAGFTYKHGTPTTHIPLPSLRRELERSIAGRAPEEAAYLSGAVKKMGQIIEAGSRLGAARSMLGPGTGEVARLQERLHSRVYGFVRELAGHTGSEGLISKILHPRIRTGIIRAGERAPRTMGGMYFQQITTGFRAEGLGLGRMLRSPGQVGLNELAISEAAALRMGISKSALQSEHFVMGQFFPEVVPGTLGTYRLKILPNTVLDENTIVTNVANRLQAFRDLDWDKMQIALFPHQVTKAQQRRAWRESVERTSSFWRAIPHAARRKLQGGEDVTKALASMLQRGPFAGWTEEQVVKALRQKALAGPYYESTMALREVLTKRFGAQSYAGQQAIGTAYQFAAIKKALAGTELSELHNILAQVPGAQGADLSGHITRATRVIEDMAKMGETSDVLLGLRGGQITEAAEQLVTAANELNALPSSQRPTLGRMNTGKSMGLRDILRSWTYGLSGDQQTLRNEFYGEMAGLGEIVRPPTDAIRGVAGVNAAAKKQGAMAAQMGGIWARARQFWAEAPTPVKYGIAGIGALLGLRVISSHLFGDEPAPSQGMNISPELGARIAMQQYAGMAGAPMPPDPLIAGGIHENSSQRPHIPFSPPPARVTSPLELGPSLTIEAADTGNADGLGLGQHVAHTLATSMGTPHVGIMTTSHGGRSTRLDLEIDREMRSENRLYNG